MTSSLRKHGTLLIVAFLALAARPANAALIIPGYTFLGTAGNYTNPSQ